jgi:hypothetical protein
MNIGYIVFTFHLVHIKHSTWYACRIFEAELPSPLSGCTEVTNHAAKLHEKGLVEWELRKTMELQVMMSDDDKIETIQVKKF